MVSLIKPGIYERTYTSWSLMWSAAIPGGLDGAETIDWVVDEVRGVITLVWYDATNYKYRMGVFKISDFSQVFISSSAVNYTETPPDTFNKQGVNYGGAVGIDYYSFSRSILSYMLLMRDDQVTIEIWRGGSSPVWSRDITVDFTGPFYTWAAGINPTGKYITVIEKREAEINMYQGS